MFKTIHIEKEISKVISYLLIDRKKKYTPRGSFFRAEYGSEITDIDIYQKFYNLSTFYNRILEIVRFKDHRVSENTSVTFLEAKLGENRALKTFPWSFNSDGEIFYRDKSAIADWIINLKGKVENSLYEKIIGMKKETFGDLLNIENLCKNYRIITWSLEEIERGYKFIGNEKYYFQSLLPSFVDDKTPLIMLSFVISCCGNRILLEYALTAPYEKNDYRWFYMKNYYKLYKHLKKSFEKAYDREICEFEKEIESCRVQKTKNKLNKLENKEYDYNCSYKLNKIIEMNLLWLISMLENKKKEFSLKALENTQKLYREIII